MFSANEQVFRHYLLTLEAHIWSQGNPSEVCAVKIVTGIGFFPSTLVLPHWLLFIQLSRMAGTAGPLAAAEPMDSVSPNPSSPH
jgi:hypothetical protein